MVDMKRAQHDLIKKDLIRKMCFLTGPRQVGKTTLARAIGNDFENPVYLNYDNFTDREMIHKMAWLPDTNLLILDELHKMAGWKNFVKGIYDTKPANLKILVTGSSRLEAFRQTGDSLAGRFFRHRLGPLTLAEIDDVGPADLERLLERGGFPEPYLTEGLVEADRWRLQYIDGLIRTDILNFEKIHGFKAMQLTLELMRERVGSPLSYASLARDIQCAPNTIKRYVEILEALFIVFRVTPYHRNIARSLLKEPKIYFYDTGMVKGGVSRRLENLVAVSLLKHLNAIEDYQGRKARLHYLRTKEKKEVDFALLIENEPLMLIEVKLSSDDLSPSLVYFHKKYRLPAIQLVKNLRHEQSKDDISIRSVFRFLGSLMM